MKIVYIKEREETNNWIDKIILCFKKIFNIIKIEQNEDKDIYYLPLLKGNKVSKYRFKTLAKKIIKNLEKDGVVDIALSTYLNTKKVLKNYLYCENINILNGRYLFKCMIYDSIEYIAKTKNIKMELGEITVLINDFTKINIENIILIAKNIKRLNIVTNHIDKCKKIESYLYDEFGIILSISNNKRTSLLKSHIIINIDFPTELLNKYRIYEKAIIINIMDKIPIESKRFNGININFYKIYMPDNYKIEGFDDEIIYESLIYKYNKLNEIRNSINEDKVRIDKFIGNNGIIRKSEISLFK